MPPIFLTAALLISFAIPAFAGGPAWTTNYAQALTEAKASNKAILLAFTGPNWCPICLGMQKAVLHAPVLGSYAEKHLVLVLVDDPYNGPQSSALKKQNGRLDQKFNITFVPTFVILDANGKELGRAVDFEAGPADLIKVVRKYYKPPAGTGDGDADDFDSLFKKPAQGG